MCYNEYMFNSDPVFGRKWTSFSSHYHVFVTVQHTAHWSLVSTISRSQLCSITRVSIFFFVQRSVSPPQIRPLNEAAVRSTVCLFVCPLPLAPKRSVLELRLVWFMVIIESLQETPYRKSNPSPVNVAVRQTAMARTSSRHENLRHQYLDRKLSYR